jgi:hypothetical protein
MPKVGPDGLVRDQDGLRLRSGSRPAIVASVNAAADAIIAALPAELRNGDRETLRCALLTAAYRLQEESSGHGRVCRGKTVGHYK